MNTMNMIIPKGGVKPMLLTSSLQCYGWRLQVIVGTVEVYNSSGKSTESYAGLPVVLTGQS